MKVVTIFSGCSWINELLFLAQMKCFVSQVNGYGILDYFWQFYRSQVQLRARTFINFLISNYIDISKLMFVVTNGAPSIVGKAKLPSVFWELKNDSLLHYQCSFYTEMRASYLESVPEISNPFKVIINVINFLVAKPVNKLLLKIFIDYLSYSKLIPYASHSKLIPHAYSC